MNGCLRGTAISCCFNTLNTLTILILPVPCPAIFGGAGFFDERSEEKNCCAAGESGTGCSKPSPVGPDYFAFWITQNIAWTVICLFLDELIFTLLRVWGSQFRISNRYTDFKIAMNAALLLWKESFLESTLHRGFLINIWYCISYLFNIKSALVV